MGTLFGEGGADKAPAMGGHKIDHFGGGVTGRGDKIAFVFTVLIVYYDNHLALPDILKGFFYSVQLNFARHTEFQIYVNYRPQPASVQAQVLNILKSKLLEPLPGMAAQKELAPVNRSLTDPDLLQPGTYRSSAVMVLLFPEASGRLSFPLIKRITYPGVHGGQVALPGGKLDAQDHGPLDAALRECREEIGLQGEPELLGSLSPLFIPVSGFLVYPFVSFLNRSEPVFTAQEREVEKIFRVDLRELLNDQNLKKGTVPVQQAKILSPYFELAGLQVWGATAMILNELRHILRSSGEWR